MALKEKRRFLLRRIETSFRDIAYGWEDVTRLYSTYYSYRRPESNSRHQHGGSNPPVTPVLKDPILSPGLQVHMWYTHIHKTTQNTQTYTLK